MPSFRFFWQSISGSRSLKNRLFIPVFQLFSAYLLNESLLSFKNFDDEKALLFHFQREVSALQSKYSRHAVSLPEIITKKFGKTIQVEFPIDQRKCDIFTLLLDIFSFLENSEMKFSPSWPIGPEDNNIKNKLIVDNDLGTNSKENFQTSSGLRAFKHENIQTFKIAFSDKSGNKGSISIAGEFRLDRPSFRFILQKETTLSDNLVDFIVKLFEEAYKPSQTREVRKQYLDELTQNYSNQNDSGILTPNSKLTPIETTLQELREMGLEVILPEQKGSLGNKSWSEIGGYEKQKRDIEDTILLSLTHSDIYDQIGRGTRVKFERNKPKTVLFEGPPGTGKTTSAKIIASIVNIPLIYVPAEAIFSKWFGESEKSLAGIFEKCAKLGKAIIFIDEIDSIAVSRDSDQLHEVSKRLVSTLLRKLDSFESENELLLICATNRKDKLDPAILSRVDLSIKFDLPDFFARKEIFKRYAKQLNEEELDIVSKMSEGLSGRGILETCKNVERKWASMVVRKEVNDLLPEIKLYTDSLKERIEKSLF